MRWKVGWHDLKSNGIRVYYFYDSGGTTHICGVGFRVGSVHDPIGAKGSSFLGMAHFAEHIVIRGDTRGPEDPVYNTMYRYFGGMEKHNIFTTYAGTYYGGPGLCYRRYMHEVMPVLVNTLKLRHIDRLALSTEKTVVNNEYRQHDLDNINSQLDELFVSTMYDTNPIRNGILGNVNLLRQVRPDSVRDFLSRNYVAENMFAVVFGPSRDESIAFAKKYLDDWPYRGNPAVLDLDAFDRVPKLHGSRTGEMHRVGLSQNYVMAGFATECYGSEDDAALDIIGSIVERRLYDVLREKSRGFKRGTYHNPTFVDRSLVHGTIGAWFATASIDFANYGRDAIIREFIRLGEELVSEDLFDGFRDSAREQFLQSFRDSPELVANLVIEASANGDSDLVHLHSYTKRLNKLTNRKLRNVANRYFNQDSFVSAMILPA